MEGDPNPFDQLTPIFKERLDLVGAQMADQVKEWISVDVEHVGGVTIRSVPGEHPRRDTGRLHDSIDVLGAGELIASEGTITVAVGTDVPYSFRLQEAMDRPIFIGLLEQFEDDAIGAIADVIEQH